MSPPLYPQRPNISIPNKGTFSLFTLHFISTGGQGSRASLRILYDTSTESPGFSH